MKQAFLILTFLFSVSFYGQSQSYNSVISDSEIENFIQWEIDNTPKFSEDRKLGKKKLLSKPESWKTAAIGLFPAAETLAFEDRFKYFLEQDTIFSSQDIKFIKSQYDSEIISDWTVEFQNVNIKNGAKLNYHIVTIPLFSEDKSKVIFWKFFYCGSLCAHACIYIYERTGQNDWKEISRFGCWIS